MTKWVIHPMVILWSSYGNPMVILWFGTYMVLKRERGKAQRDKE